VSSSSHILIVITIILSARKNQRCAELQKTSQYEVPPMVAEPTKTIDVHRILVRLRWRLHALIRPCLRTWMDRRCEDYIRDRDWTVFDVPLSDINSMSETAWSQSLKVQAVFGSGDEYKSVYQVWEELDRVRRWLEGLAADGMMEKDISEDYREERLDYQVFLTTGIDTL
jgi:hypothetical protein